MPEPALELESLSKRYGDIVAVDDVCFTAEPGCVTGFLGPNGAGKSTAMRAMVGLTRPTSGRVRVLGRSYSDLDNPGREVGVLLDASAQHAGRTGREGSQSRSARSASRWAASTRCSNWSA